MSEQETKSESANPEQITAEPEQKLSVAELMQAFKVHPISSAEMIKTNRDEPRTSSFNEEPNISTLESGRSLPGEADFSGGETDSSTEKSSVFKLLSEPKLPDLPKENRARLQMQSPTRLYFYWSIKNNPFETLNLVFGADAADFTLVAKLVNQTQNTEEIVPIEPEGATWFDVDANSFYQAEIGFYAARRPFSRLMFSNTIETPRKNPSPHLDFSVDWAVSADKFAQVLDVSGFAHDAIEVALAGDDPQFAETSTRNAFSQITGNQDNNFTEDYVREYAAEIRFALLALASGYAAETLRGQISKSLLEKLLETVEDLSQEKALDALQENFGDFTGETIDEEFGQTIFGVSSINFPRFSKRRNLLKFAPVSSFRF